MNVGVCLFPNTVLTIRNFSMVKLGTKVPNTIRIQFKTSYILRILGFISYSQEKIVIVHNRGWMSGKSQNMTKSSILVRYKYDISLKV